MKRLREYMRDNPSAGWFFAAMLAVAAAVLLYSRVATKSETGQLTELVTIRDTETGDTWTVPRGVMEKELYLRPFPVDLAQGLINPKTGKPNGFPIDAWKETVTRVNAERQAVAEAGSQEAPSPPKGK